MPGRGVTSVSTLPHHVTMISGSEQGPQQRHPAYSKSGMVSLASSPSASTQQQPLLRLFPTRLQATRQALCNTALRSGRDTAPDAHCSNGTCAHLIHWRVVLLRKTWLSLKQLSTPTQDDERLCRSEFGVSSARAAHGTRGYRQRPSPPNPHNDNRCAEKLHSAARCAQAASATHSKNRRVEFDSRASISRPHAASRALRLWPKLPRQRVNFKLAQHECYRFTTGVSCAIPHANALTGNALELLQDGVHSQRLGQPGEPRVEDATGLQSARWRPGAATRCVSGAHTQRARTRPKRCPTSDSEPRQAIAASATANPQRWKRANQSAAASHWYRRSLT